MRTATDDAVFVNLDFVGPTERDDLGSDLDF
jgi:hypothetical protein